MLRLELAPLEPEELGDRVGDDATPPYLVVCTRKGAVRRLHRTDGCWRAVAFSFKEFECIYEDPVPTDKYSHYCHDCWPTTAPVVCSSGSDEASDSSEGSSSSTGE